MKAKKKEAAAAAAPPAGKKTAVLNPQPEFIQEREELWARLKAEREAWLAAQTPQPIK